MKVLLVLFWITTFAFAETISAQDYKLVDPETHQEKGQLHLGTELSSVELDGKKYLLEAATPAETRSSLKAKEIPLGPLHVKNMPFGEYVNLLRDLSSRNDPARKKAPASAGVNIIVVGTPPNLKVSFNLADHSLFDALGYLAMAAGCELVFEDSGVKLVKR